MARFWTSMGARRPSPAKLWHFRDFDSGWMPILFIPQVCPRVKEHPRTKRKHNRSPRSTRNCGWDTKDQNGEWPREKDNGCIDQTLTGNWLYLTTRTDLSSDGPRATFPQKNFHPSTYKLAMMYIQRFIWKLYFYISSKEILKELSHSLSTYRNGTAIRMLSLNKEKNRI